MDAHSQTRSLECSKAVCTHIVLPSHTNSLQSIFGGVMMSWIDMAASVSAGRYAQGPVVTASVDALSFLNPAFTGWVIELNSRVTFVARTSMEVFVNVRAEATYVKKPIAQARLTFVAIDNKGHPRPLPQPTLTTDNERREFEAASQRRQQRLRERNVENH